MQTQRGPRRELRILAIIVAMTGLWGCQTTATFATEVAAIDANCPATYPDVVSPPPPLAELESMSADELIARLDHWSPAYRHRVGEALAGKLPGARDKIIAAMTDPNWRRRNGVIAALGQAMIHVKMYRRNVARNRPVTADDKAAAEATVKQFASVTPHLIKALKDEHPLVRVRAIGVLSALGPAATDAADGLLTVAETSPPWVGEIAVMALARSVGPAKLDPATRMDRLIAMLKHPKPRARGAAIQVMGQLPADEAKVAIPALLASINDRAKRDAMFSDAARNNAMALLTKWRVREVIPLIIMVAKEEGWGLGRRRAGTSAALKDWGPDAKEAIPEVETIIKDIEAGSGNTEAAARPFREALAAMRGEKAPQ